VSNLLASYDTVVADALAFNPPPASGLKRTGLVRGQSSVRAFGHQKSALLALVFNPM
jgi:hypothetical protein